MTLLIGAAVFATAIAVAGTVGRWLDHREAARPPRTPVGARYVDAPGYPPLAHREPDQPGHMTLTDIEDMHTAIGRITRAAAERQQQP